MTRCEYCGCLFNSSREKCYNCGAPIKNLVAPPRPATKAQMEIAELTSLLDDPRIKTATQLALYANISVQKAHAIMRRARMANPALQG